jgi:hypothetical protein
VPSAAAWVSALSHAWGVMVPWVPSGPDPA